VARNFCCSASSAAKQIRRAPAALMEFWTVGVPHAANSGVAAGETELPWPWCRRRGRAAADRRGRADMADRSAHAALARKRRVASPTPMRVVTSNPAASATRRSGRNARPCARAIASAGRLRSSGVTWVSVERLDVAHGDGRH